MAGITDSQGNRLIDFHYEGYGAGYYTSYDTEKAALLAQINPFGYRSYVMDLGTGMYYLQSRYYDPTLGRFINADGLISTGQGFIGNNMFAYCGNNPVSFTDPSGNDLISAIIAAGLILGLGLLLTGCELPPQNNCYTHMLKLENDPRTGQPFDSKPNPGDFSDLGGLSEKDLSVDSEEMKKEIEKRTSADVKSLGLRTFEKVDSYDHEPAPGNWVVALAYTEGLDYHWWRREADGTWSHKPGTHDVMYWDWSNNIIYDPSQSDMGVYEVFLGYYEIGPN